MVHIPQKWLDVSSAAMVTTHVQYYKAEISFLSSILNLYQYFSNKTANMGDVFRQNKFPRFF